MVADIGRVVAGGAKSGKVLHVKHVIDSRDIRDVDPCGVEHFLAARDRLAVLRFVVLAPEAQPRLVEGEDIGVEGRARGIQSERIVYADEELRKFRGERARTASRVTSMQRVCFVIEVLRGENAG